MIGISLASYPADSVAEFFELFKTPWEPIEPGRHYDVVISDRRIADIPEPRLLILTKRMNGGSRGVSDRFGVVLVRSGVECFPVYGGARAVSGGEPLQFDAHTGDSLAIRFIQGPGTVIQLGYDIFEETRLLLARGQPADFAEYSTLDLHIANLRNWVLAAGVPLVEIPPVSIGHPFLACLTHDVDFGGIRHYGFSRTLVGFVLRALIAAPVRFLRGILPLSALARNWLAVAELPFVFLGLRPDFWSTFRDYRVLERDFPSTFFFVPLRNESGRMGGGRAPAARAVKYDAGDFAGNMADLVASGAEIGVHGIDSWLNADRGQLELSKISRLAGKFPGGVRMHWLYFDPDSPEVLESAGYSYDSSWGYNETVGFRAGTSQVFRPPGAERLLELPLNVMDTALFYPDRLNLNPAEASEVMAELMERAERFGGVLTFNWHDRSLAPERLWEGVYRWILEELRRRNARVLTAAAAVEWFRKRRSVRFKGISVGETSVRIRLAAEGVDPTDGLVLRFHDPADASHQDFVLGEQEEFLCSLK